MKTNFREQWYKDEDVKDLISQIEKVMLKYEVESMGFNAHEESVKYKCNLYAGPTTEHKVKTGYGVEMFHLEFADGRMVIDL